MRLRLKQIAGDGAAVGDVPTWSGADWAPAAPSGGGGGGTVTMHCELSRTSSQSIPSSTWTALEATAAIQNDSLAGSAMWDSSQGTRMYARRTAWYLLQGTYNPSSGVGGHLINFGINGGIGPRGNVMRLPGQDTSETSLVYPVKLAAGDYVEIFAYFYSAITIGSSYIGLHEMA